MNQFPFLRILILIQAIAESSGAVKESRNNSIEDLLRPMRNLQVIIRLQERGYLPSERKVLEFPLQLTLDFLHGNNAPFQIVSDNMRNPALDFHARYVDNRVSWLVFLVASETSEKIRMKNILWSCVVWSAEGTEYIAREQSVLEKHLINALVLDSSGSGHSGFDLSLYRTLTPFYFMVFNWIPSVRKFVQPPWAFDVWFGKTSHRVIEMPWYFSLAEQQGIDGVIRNVSRARKDFQGDRLPIYPSFGLFRERKWESWKEFSAVPFRQKITTEDVQRAYLGFILLTLAEQHNLTFDTIIWMTNKGIEPSFINMLANAYSIEYRGMKFSLNKYMYESTLMSSELNSVPPFILTSLRMPVDMPALVLLLSLTMSAALIFNRGQPRSHLVDKFLLSISSFWHQTYPPSKGKVSRWFHILWLLFGMYVALYYATVLQSHTVTPSTFVSDLSFEEMLGQEFEFVSIDPRDLQERGTLASYVLN